jgi:hypothetical protein
MQGTWPRNCPASSRSRVGRGVGGRGRVGGGLGGDGGPPHERPCVLQLVLYLRIMYLILVMAAALV